MFEDSGRLVNFVKDNLNDINAKLEQHGAVLLRGFRTRALREFQEVSETICNELFDYTYRSSPRTKLGGKVYTSTEYPKEREIPQHNENSYSLAWPKKIIFHCVVEPKVQGETPIANSAIVYQLINPAIRKEFEKKRILYVRNYKDGLDLSWKEVFQTESKEDVQKYCQQNQIDYEWIAEGHLRTKQICQASITHPITKETLWFNQAHLFHESANDDETRQYLLANYEPDELPRNTFFGDGAGISSEKLEAIRDAYREAEIVFPWRKGDLLILDNLRYSHGRRPFDGQRKIVVSMGN